MTWPTHTLFGISTVWLLAPVPPEILQANTGVLAVAAALGALMPDWTLPSRRSSTSRSRTHKCKPFMLPGLVVSRTDQHRGLLHSLAGLGMMAIFVLPTFFYGDWAVAVAFLLGYASHLVADSATKSGIRLLYPRAQRFHLLPKRWCFTTGSFVEEVLFVPLALCCIVLLLRSLLWT